MGSRAQDASRCLLRHSGIARDWQPQETCTRYDYGYGTSPSPFALASLLRTKLSSTSPKTLAIRQIPASSDKRADIVRRIWTATPRLSGMLEIARERPDRDAPPPRASQVLVSGVSGA